MSIVHQTAAQASSRSDRPPPLALGGAPRQQRPYALARAWVEADPRVRVRRSAQAAAAYKAIGLLPRAWGERLDAIGASHRELRWLASGNTSAREARYLALVDLLETAAPGARSRAFEDLMRAMPKVRAPKGAR